MAWRIDNRRYVARWPLKPTQSGPLACTPKPVVTTPAADRRAITEQRGSITMQESKPRYVEVVSWDDRRGDYLVYPTAVAQQSKSRLVTEEGDVYTWRRSGKYVLRYRVDSVYSPSIRKHDVEPFKEYWMFGSLRQPTGRN